jgi:hypothetical protein
MTTPPKPRVFVDSDVLFAGAASSSEHGASLVVLRMAEITLIEAIVSEQVIVEVERNLAEYLPATLPVFRQLVSRCLRIVPDPAAAELDFQRLKADPEHIGQHLQGYITGFWANLRQIFERFEFTTEIERMAEANILLHERPRVPKGGC